MRCSLTKTPVMGLSTRPLGVCALLFGATVARAGAPLTVCPAAQAPTKDGKPQTVYVIGHDDWLFRQQQDLNVDYPDPAVPNPMLRQLQQTLAVRGTTLVVARLPPRGIVHPDKINLSATGAAGFDATQATASYQAHLAWIRSHNILAPDLLDAMQRTTPVPGDAYRARDHHWRPEGAERSAFAIAQMIRDHAGQTPLPAATFARHDRSPESHRGALLLQVEQICGPQPHIPDETIPVSTTVAAAGAIDAAALFDDAPQPEVVVVGDSNTNKGGRDLFNFGGALREALGTDVLNVAVDGAGLFPPLLAYLASPAFQEQPPRYLVWVSGAHLPIHNRSQLQQAVGAAQGPCTANHVRHFQQRVKDAAPDGSFALPLPQAASGDGLRVEVSATAPTAFALRLQQNGKTQQVAVRRSPRVGEASPTVIAVLPEKGPLEAIQIAPWASVDQPFVVQVCSNPKPAPHPPGAR